MRSRHPRRQSRVYAAAVGFALFALGQPATGAEGRPLRPEHETERISRTVKLEPGGTLRLENFSGRVTITASNESQVVVDAVRRAPRERLDRIKLDVHTEGSTVVVNANQRDHRDSGWFHDHDNVVDTELSVTVPARTSLDLHAFSSPVEARGLEGSHRVHTFSGSVLLDDVAGQVDAHTFSGRVEIRAKAWQPNQHIDVHTFSGSVELHVPESARGSVEFNSFSGRLTSDLPLTLHSASRRSLHADLGAADGNGGRLTFKTFSGNVRIDR